LFTGRLYVKARILAISSPMRLFCVPCGQIVAKLARTHEHTLRRIPFIRTPEAIVIASTQQPCTQWAQVAFSSVRFPVKF